jgi:predicted glycosyl hydrolase (DUF1957 family)
MKQKLVQCDNQAMANNREDNTPLEWGSWGDAKALSVWMEDSVLFIFFFIMK